MQPSEIEALPFYEIEYTIENLTNDLKNKQDAENGGENQQSASSYMKDGQKMISSAKMSGAGRSINTPKMPRMPNISGKGFKL